MKKYVVLYYYWSFKFLPAKINVLQWKIDAKSEIDAMYRFSCLHRVYMADIKVLNAIEVSK